MPRLISQMEFAQISVNVPGFLAEFWPIVVVAVLGGASIFLLLPRPKRFPQIVGFAIGLLAVAMVGWKLVQADENWAESFLFYAFSGLAIFSGGVMITQTQPVRAALSFAMVILSTSGLFLLQAAPFLMAATIAVYAGAIVVTFLFVIMLAQQSGLSSADVRTREPLLACVAGFVLLAALLCVLTRAHTPAAPETSRQLDALLRKIHLAAKARSIEEMELLLPRDKKGDVVLVAKIRKLGQRLAAKLDNSKKDQPQNEKSALPPNVKKAAGFAKMIDRPCDDFVQDWEEKKHGKIQEDLKKIYAAGTRVLFAMQGTLQPPDLELSSFSGTPPDEVPVRDVSGRAHMPSDNVAALGRSLFTDYLLAVELAATLLLVATIGAIAIAGRKAEKLK